MPCEREHSNTCRQTGEAEDEIPFRARVKVRVRDGQDAVRVSNLVLLESVQNLPSVQLVSSKEWVDTLLDLMVLEEVSR